MVLIVAQRLKAEFEQKAIAGTGGNPNQIAAPIWRIASKQWRSK
jgi:hypothetical protein